MTTRMLPILAACFALLCFSTGALAEGPKVLHVSDKATIVKDAGQTATAVAGMPLSPGDAIRVDGPGYAVITDKASDTHVRVERLSITRYKGKDPETGATYTVPDGTVRFTVKPGTKLEVRTPHMVASVRGTEFVTEVTRAGTTLAVDSGLVQTGDRAGNSESVGSGSTVAAGMDGFTEPDSPAMQQHRREVQAKNAVA